MRGLAIVLAVLGVLMAAVGVIAMQAGLDWVLPVAGGNGRRSFQAHAFLFGLGAGLVGIVAGIAIAAWPRLALAKTLRRAEPDAAVFLAQTTRDTAQFLKRTQAALGAAWPARPIYLVLRVADRALEIWGRDTAAPMLRVPASDVRSVGEEFVVTSRRLPAVRVDAVIGDEPVSLFLLLGRPGWELFPVFDRERVRRMAEPLRALAP